MAGYRHPRCLKPEYASALLQMFARPAPLLEVVERVGDRIAVVFSRREQAVPARLT